VKTQKIISRDLNKIDHGGEQIFLQSEMCDAIAIYR